MVISCSVPTCKNRFQKGGDIQFHSFPLRRDDMSRRWAEAIGRTDWIPTKNSFVCSQHFTSNDYQIRPGKHKHFLREDAIPSVFPPSMPPRRRGLFFKPAAVSPAQPSLPRKLPFILPSHLEIKSCSPSPVPSSTPPYDPAVELLPATLPSGVSITPLKRTHQKSPSPLFPQYDTFSNGNNPYKRMKHIIPKDLPVLHPSNNTSVFLTGGKPAKPIPSLTPLYPKLDQFDPREDQNGDDEPVDVTQFLSISLQAEEEQYSHRPQLGNLNSVCDTTTSEILRRKHGYMQKEIQKRDMTIKSLQHQMREMRKKMDSISVKKILNDSFKGLTYDILENYLNNVSLDSCEKSYSANVKEFSMKLLELSPQAYALVRSQFDLPHPANVSHWLRSANEAEEEEERYKDSPQDTTSLHEDSEEHIEEEALDIKEEAVDIQEEAVDIKEDAVDIKRRVEDVVEPAVEAQPSESQSESFHSVVENLKAEDVNVVMETEEAC